MRQQLFRLVVDRSASAAAEMALVSPVLIALLFGSLELGNYFLDQHALEKQVRDGARFAARMELDSATYSCPGSVFIDPDADDKIINVTKTGAVSGAGNPRWTDYWDRNCPGVAQTVTVALTCVDKDEIDTPADGFTGIYTELDGDIPVVTVSAAVRYRSILSSLGFDTTSRCLRAESKAAVTGL